MPVRLLVVPWLAMVLLVAGCGRSDGHLVTVPVELSVYHDDKPATGAVVSLVPLPDTPASEHGLKPTGVVNENDAVVFSTYESGDGAPEGTFQVVIFWPAEQSAQEMAKQMESGRRMRTDKLQGKYATPEQSPFTVTIERGKKLDRIDLP